MKIRGLNVRPAWCASGVQGFFESDRYWYQKLMAPIGMWLCFHFITFVSKTSTQNARSGKMPLDEKDGITPKEWIPKCIYVNWRKRVVLNAVSLSGPGLKSLLDRGHWQKRREDFFISLMSVAPTLEERASEIREMVKMLMDRRGEFHAKFGIQLNVSCPNKKVKLQGIVDESHVLLDVINEEDPEGRLAVEVKFAPTATPEEIHEATLHRRCDSICLGNTLPYGELPNLVNWVYYFGSADPKDSPLMKRGVGLPGGLSGKPLLPIICNQIKGARTLGVKKPINACGGITGPISTWKAMCTGADVISIGTGVMLAPWGVFASIVVAYIITWYRENFRGLTKMKWEIPFVPTKKDYKHE